MKYYRVLILMTSLLFFNCSDDENSVPEEIITEEVTEDPQEDVATFLKINRGSDNFISTIDLSSEIEVLGIITTPEGEVLSSKIIESDTTVSFENTTNYNQEYYLTIVAKYSGVFTATNQFQERTFLTTFLDVVDETYFLDYNEEDSDDNESSATLNILDLNEPLEIIKGDFSFSCEPTLDDNSKELLVTGTNEDFYATMKKSDEVNGRYFYQENISPEQTINVPFFSIPQADKMSFSISPYPITEVTIRGENNNSEKRHFIDRAGTCGEENLTDFDFYLPSNTSIFNSYSMEAISVDLDNSLFYIYRRAESLIENLSTNITYRNYNITPVSESIDNLTIEISGDSYTFFEIIFGFQSLPQDTITSWSVIGDETSVINLELPDLFSDPSLQEFLPDYLSYMDLMYISSTLHYQPDVTNTKDYIDKILDIESFPDNEDVYINF